MKTERKIKIFVWSFLLTEIFGLILIVSPIYYLYQGENLESLAVLLTKIPVILLMAATGGFFLTSLFFFIDVMRHPVPWKGI
jgi:hypothetical protein